MANLGLTGIQALQIVFLVRSVGVNAAAVGILITAGSLGGILAAVIADPVGRRFGTARGMLLTQLLTFPFALLMPLAAPGTGLVFFAVGTFVLGLGIVACNIVLGSFRQSYCRPHLMGRVVATTMVINHSTIPLGSLLGGYLGGLLGPRPALWIMTGLLAPSWLILALGPMRKTRDLPTSYRPEPGDEALEEKSRARRGAHRRGGPL